jgi:hypothetical protein
MTRIHDYRYGAGRDLLRASEQEVDRILKREDAAEVAAVERSYWSRFPAPTAGRLRKHAARFGPEGVQDIAAVYAVDLTTPKPASTARQRRTTETLVRQVVDLRKRGLRVWPIAKKLNISERRVSAILASATV